MLSRSMFFSACAPLRTGSLWRGNSKTPIGGSSPPPSGNQATRTPIPLAPRVSPPFPSLWTFQRRGDTLLWTLHRNAGVHGAAHKRKGHGHQEIGSAAGNAGPDDLENP